MNNGYWGKLLRVDLTNMKLSDEIVPEKIWREYVGGVGLAARYIKDEVPTHVKPLDPENRLMFVTGPYQMTNFPGSGRWEVASISPLTGIWGEANGGGYFGTKLKRAGYDGIIIEGKAKTPVYLLLDDSTKELKDASGLWGKDSRESAEILAELYGHDYSSVTIGQAGEKMVPMACIVSDKAHGIAGRTGMGAVMGSKNLKAIIVNGSKVLEPFDKGKYDEIYSRIRKGALENEFGKLFRLHGEPIEVVGREQLGSLPMGNWKVGVWPEGAAKLGTPTYTELLKVKPKACAYCPIACHRQVTIEDGEFYDHKGPGAEYETLGMIGSLLLIDDLKKVSYANDLCNRYGIDTISVGGVIGFVFECFEKGLITKEQLDGIEAKWGDADALISFVKKIGNAEGIGIELGKGSRHMSNIVGKDSKDWSMEVNNLEIPAHDPRAYTSMAVSYVTSTRGACHLHGSSEGFEKGLMIPEIGITDSEDRFSNSRKGMAATKYQDWAALFNSLIQCNIYPALGMTVTDQADLLNALNGWDITPLELMKTGERIHTLQHLINLDRGLTVNDMKLPRRILEPLSGGGTEGHVPDIKLQLKEYFEARNWSQDAIPSSEKLKELNLI